MKVYRERKDIVTIRGNPVTLVGSELKPGDKAPDFTVLDGDLKEIRLRDFAGRIKVISVTASLDTPICYMQTRKFNQEAAQLSDTAVMLTITMDLPFAISLFCMTAGVDKIKTLSDHKYASFGNAYGVLIKELRLLAHSVFVIDEDDTVRYIEIIPELTHYYTYDKAFHYVKKLA
ncbi:MAG: thiol peroxidase [Candidatus Jettenia sp.]|uniref:Thioredoxin domain-containing protein n=1 Tax=Candidatus Jettenia caeni TaxID=247490 RepID=I3IKF2_9BACT|nr:thiol peroxidase [Candidatus Jettenia sp. AMX1]MBC6930361.1 thiol peroxidase [Candidatus Jettenia sp.]NUN23118.1 thiol peroxidase [Candidatus Jettenia caeni]KAA0247479.1 MAG: thiol peroxidase [Candidatus Jettenia sp. AMX1]MCE7881958.1 thiol peroxidase [Candidatus Jettenia sp. AMX1]MCQ3928516.1 thiol peroxidase [Candidatus Jettenia sp.]